MVSVLRARARRERDQPEQTTVGARSISKSEKAAAQKLTKRVLEDQMRLKMQSLWLDVQAAEVGIDEGKQGALDRLIYAAGTMIENFRLAKGNFNKNRVFVVRLDQS